MAGAGLGMVRSGLGSGFLRVCVCVYVCVCVWDRRRGLQPLQLVKQLSQLAVHSSDRGAVSATRGPLTRGADRVPRVHMAWSRAVREVECDVRGVLWREHVRGEGDRVEIVVRKVLRRGLGQVT